MKRPASVSGHIVDILNREIFDGTVVLSEGRIERIIKGGVPDGAPFILPGLTDSHIHIESTLLTPEHYAALAVSKGVVAAVTDPHEIANVLGMDGVDFMIGNSRKVRFHFSFGASPCVPCTGFETAGAVLTPDDITALLQRDEVYGVAEFMNAVGVMCGDPSCAAKLDAARKAGKPVDGHAPGLSRDEVARYAAAGISTDHECVSLAEAQDRLDAGMIVQIREGSAAKDFEALSPLLADSGDRLMFCSDDMYPDELAEGYIDSMVRRALKKGYPLWNTLNAACVTPVRHYGLKAGLLRPGDGADFILVDSLSEFNVLATYIDGECVFEGGKMLEESFVLDGSPLESTPNKFVADPISKDQLGVHPGEGRLRVISARDLSLRTVEMLADPAVSGGKVVPDTGRDILKMVVCNRYGKAEPSIAFIHGFSLKKGAMASTIAHDSHNIVAIGTDDDEIVKVVNRLVALRGGIVASDGETVTELPLPIAGLMSPLTGVEVAERHLALKRQVAAMGCSFKAPFMTMAFMCIPVIPDLKLTDKGLFDARIFNFTGLFEGGTKS